jgi:serine/threonine protein kinase
LQGTLDGPLALKISDDYQAESKYILEVAANLRTPTHERIVPLLSAFKHRGKFHLILPWASGGNLADLIQKYYTPGTKALDGQLAADWYSEEWLLAQCLGLAEGLDAIHQRSLLRQIHADIKPENILCFTPSDKSSGPFTLKLADFGEAKEVNSDDGTILVKHVPHTKTYRPPEHDTDEVLSLNYDVWCLGCVFLEFITWAIAGSESKESFEDARLNERDDRKASTAKGTVLQDTFFKKASASWRPRILPQIRVEHNSTTIEAGGLPRKVYRRQHRWSLEYAGSTRVRTLRKKVVQKVSF